MRQLFGGFVTRRPRIIRCCPLLLRVPRRCRGDTRIRCTAMDLLRIVGLLAVLAISDTGQAQSGQSASSKANAATDEAPQSSSPACSALVERSWQSAERKVWLSLCAGEAVDLAKISGPGMASFVDEIFDDPSRQAMLKDARIQISHGTIDDFTIYGLESRSLTLTDVRILKNFTLYDSTVSDTVTLENVSVEGNIDIKNLTARRFSQDSSSVANSNSLSVRDSRLDKLSVDQSDDPAINIFTSQIGNIDISKVGNTNIKLWSVGGSQIDIIDSGKLTVSLSEVSVTGGIRSTNDLWDSSASKGGPPLVLSYVAGQEFSLFSASPGYQPPRIGVEHASFGAVNFGSDPLPAVYGIQPASDQDKSVDGPPFLPFLAATIRNYAANGRTDIAQEITYNSNLLNKPITNIWNRGFWWARRITVGFGQRVQWGIYWIIGLVVVGWLVFRSGRKDLVDPNARPDSWMLFAIDTVIPVIQLDRRHDAVAFTGWRQWYLSFLRVMGAVLVFLVFYFLKQVLLGSQ